MSDNLRDWFAGQALNGATSSLESEQAIQKAARQFGMKTTDFMAKCCYDYADAMLRYRSENPQ